MTLISDPRHRYASVSTLGNMPETAFGIHQVLAAAAPGDAITNAAIEFRELLKLAAPSEIYARHVAPELSSEVRPLRDFSHRDKRGVLLYHASIGEPAVTAFLHSRREPLVLVYHNITPSHYFEPWDVAFAELLALGRREVHGLSERTSMAIAASAYNAVELEGMGYRDIRVIPPVINPRRLVELAPEPTMLNYLDTVLKVPFVLFVGQLVPHKRPELLVQAMHIARTYLGLQACCLLVGPQRFPRYTAAIVDEVHQLNLSTVHLVGGIPDASLAATFRRARAMVTASEHEGFCVPLLEAMAFGVPVIARACAAIPEVVGDGGLLLPSNAEPELIAEAIESVVDDDKLRADLSARGLERVEHFDETAARSALLTALAEVV
jgi:glycosyltransferase involved in cell wall biosynthesis